MRPRVDQGWFPARTPPHVARFVLRFCEPADRGRMARVCVLARELCRSPHSWPTTVAHGHTFEPGAADDPDRFYLRRHVPGEVMRRLRLERLGWNGEGFEPATQLSSESCAALHTLSLAAFADETWGDPRRLACTLADRDLAALAALPRLTSLFFWRCSLPDGLRGLSTAPSLTHLTIRPRDGLELSTLGAVAARLASLDVVLPALDHANRAGAPAHNLAAVERMAALRTLLLRVADKPQDHGRHDPSVPPSLVRLPASLTSLAIRGLVVPGRLAASIAQAPSLTFLDVDSSKIAQDRLRLIVHEQPLALRQLRLTSWCNSFLPFRHLCRDLTPSSAIARIRMLELEDFHVTVAEMRALVAAMTGLERLGLRGATLTRQTLAPLAVCRAPITALSLAGSNVTSAALQSVAHLPLKLLDVRHTAVSDRSKAVQQLRARGATVLLPVARLVFAAH